MSKQKIKPTLRILQRDCKEIKLHNKQQVGSLVWNLLDHLQLKYGWDRVHEMVEIGCGPRETKALCDDLHFVMKFEETK